MLLEITDLHVHYGKVHALRGISLSVDQGEVVSLIGCNGAGKSTTLKAISGVLAPSSGSVRFNGNSLAGLPAHRVVKLGISHAPEGRGIFPGMSVMENLEMGAFIHGSLRRPKLKADLDRVFTMFPVLKERHRQQGGTLSGGEQQMLAIGRALMARPTMLLLDEPSMGLAPLRVRQVLDIMSTIRDQGTTILVVEQNAAQVLRRADRAYVIESGTIVQHGSGQELLNDPRVRSAYLGGTEDRPPTPEPPPD